MSESAAPPQIRLLLGAVFLVYLGQMTLNPIIAPLSREVGLAEWQVGATISAAAVMIVITSQFWGRRSQSWGRKPVLVAAFALATTTMTLFCLLAWLGTRGIVVGVVLFVLFVVLRGIAFGAAIAAVPTTAQAYIADVTTDEATRVKGMAGIGAVQGVAMVAGSVVGGFLSAFDLLAPLVAVPVLLAAGLTLVALRLRREPRHELVERPKRISPRDPRVWPFLLAGFGMFTALGFIQVIIGFIIQDRLRLDAEATGLATGGALLAAGVGIIVAQAVIVPRSGWPPSTLLRAGGVGALIGFGLLAPDLGATPLFVAILLIGSASAPPCPATPPVPLSWSTVTSKAGSPGSPAPPPGSPSWSHRRPAPLSTGCRPLCRSSSAPRSWEPSPSSSSSIPASGRPGPTPGGGAGVGWSASRARVAMRLGAERRSLAFAHVDHGHTKTRIVG